MTVKVLCENKLPRFASPRTGKGVGVGGGGGGGGGRYQTIAYFKIIIRENTRSRQATDLS